MVVSGLIGYSYSEPFITLASDYFYDSILLTAKVRNVVEAETK